MAAAAAGHTILAPNIELAAALFDAIERMHQDAGRDIWPTPRVRDFGSWLRDRHAARQLEDAALPRVLGDIEERELWRAVVDSSESGSQILEPSGAARAARRARRAIREYGISLQALADCAPGSDETRVFLDWNRRFDARCRQLDCLGGDDLFDGALPPSEPIAWIESPVWRPMARQWLARHGRMLTPPTIECRALRLAAASPAAELAAIADWALRNLRSAARFRAWICVPDLSLRRAQVVDAFDAALAPQRYALSGGADAAIYAVAGGTPLAQFAPVHAALEILAASIEVMPFERFSMLLRAPELHESQAEAGAAALLDVQLRAQGPHEADFATWLVLAERISASRWTVPALQRLRSAQWALEELRGNHYLSRWVVVWMAAFESAPWALRNRWSSTEYQAAERFRELLASLATADATLGTHSRRSAQQVLRRAALDTAFQVQTGIPPIWVSGQLIDPWLPYDGLWISGGDAERWPPPVKPIEFLPLRLQRDAGVIGAAAETQLQFAVDMQVRWRARAADCRFSCADPGDGRSASPSPLLLDVPSTTSDAPPRPHWQLLLQSAPRLERLTDELAPAFAPDERVRGVAALKAQSRCAFRGFAETRLILDKLERPVPGFNARERGELIHLALQHIWTVLRDSNVLQALAQPAQAELLSVAAARALSTVCRGRDPGPRWRRREYERMQQVLAKWMDAERQRPWFAVEQLEQEGLTARHANLSFPVRIDRVDRLADGTRVLIDYKTGIAKKDWRGERPDNPQLPIYALLRPERLVAVAYGQVNANECRFVAEAERRPIFTQRPHKLGLEGLPSLAALLAVWSVRLATLAEDFMAGRAAVAPTLLACKSCHLHGLCRVPAALEDAVDSHD
jgi:ATP-dependent helicase/nuclease subunit B